MVPRAPNLHEMCLFLERLQSEKTPPVVKAAQTGNLDVVKKFIANGGDINCHFNSINKYTLLHHAAENGHKHIVDHLLKCEGINPSAKDAQNTIPLHLAALNAHPEIVMQLCEATQNKNINTKTAYGSTPLHMAIDEAHTPEMIKRSNTVMDYLLSIPGADAVIFTCEHETPMTLAKKYHRPDLLEKLIKATARTLFIKAIHPGDYDKNEVIISFDSDKGINEQLWMEIVIPNLITAFDNNPESKYKLSSKMERIGFDFVSYLARKDGNSLNLQHQEDTRLLAIELSTILAVKTDIRLRKFCRRYLDFDIFPYKTNQVKSAFQAFLIPVLISICRQIHQLQLNNVDIWFNIFSYINNDIKNHQDVSNAFDHILQLILNGDGGSLLNFYSSTGGNAFKVYRLFLFSQTSTEKIKTLKTWANENQDNAAMKTVNHYFLNSRK